MAKGQISKDIIAKKLLETFEGSFKNDKEIRVPMTENGEIVEIKITLTAAKDVLGSAEAAISASQNNEINFEDVKPAEISQKEKDNVAKLAQLFNL